jgi:hypothetical protein
MASPHSTPPPDSAPASDQREAAGPLVAAIEEAASFLAAFWNRETEDLPTSATQLHVLLIVERHRGGVGYGQPAADRHAVAADPIGPDRQSEHLHRLGPGALSRCKTVDTRHD